MQYPLVLGVKAISSQAQSCVVTGGNTTNKAPFKTPVENEKKRRERPKRGEAGTAKLQNFIENQALVAGLLALIQTKIFALSLFTFSIFPQFRLTTTSLFT